MEIDLTRLWMGLAFGTAIGLAAFREIRRWSVQKCLKLLAGGWLLLPVVFAYLWLVAGLPNIVDGTAWLYTTGGASTWVWTYCAFLTVFSIASLSRLVGSRDNRNLEINEP